MNSSPDANVKRPGRLLDEAAPKEQSALHHQAASSSATLRRWHFDRQYFATVVQQTADELCRGIMIELANLARFEDGDVALGDGTLVHLQRGQALFSMAELAASLRSNQTTVYNMIQLLIRTGHLQAGMKGWRKRAKRPLRELVREAQKYTGQDSATEFFGRIARR